MSINELINQSEGRRLEFKGELPTNSDLAKTVVAFANDAGGEIYIGINDNPRQIIGLSEEELPRIEEQISNLIYDRCYPIILPEVSFLTIEDKHLIKVCIYRGSMPPYYLKDKGKLKGTYIRVGSTNKLADETIIAELERRRRNISFDSEVVMDKSADELDISGFKLLYKEKTGEDLNIQVLRKLELVKTEQDKEYPTKALLLFSDAHAAVDREGLEEAPEHWVLLVDVGGVVELSQVVVAWVQLAHEIVEDLAFARRLPAGEDDQETEVGVLHLALQRTKLTAEF